MLTTILEDNGHCIVTMKGATGSLRCKVEDIGDLHAAIDYFLIDRDENFEPSMSRTQAEIDAEVGADEWRAKNESRCF